MSAELISLLESDPAAGILAVAEFREQRAKAATPGPYIAGGIGDYGWSVHAKDVPARELDWLSIETYDSERGKADAEHIAAEANPAHALAAVRRWRGVVERHKSFTPIFGGTGPSPRCTWCLTHPEERIGWPCPDLTETADEAKAYLGGPS